MSCNSKMYFSLTQQSEAGVPGWVNFVCCCLFLFYEMFCSKGHLRFLGHFQLVVHVYRILSYQQMCSKDGGSAMGGIYGWSLKKGFCPELRLMAALK